MATSQKIKIAARLRPLIQGEIDDDSVKVVHPSDNTSASSLSGPSFISVANPRDPSQIFKFPFSSCYDENSNQEEIFRNDVEPLIDVVYSGVTVTIFAYGVTSSGKTHTMQGTKSDQGVIPRVVRGMCEKRRQLRQYQTSLQVSYMEIYKDEVYDLLVTRENAPKLPVRENDSGMVFVANLSKIPISSVDEFDHIYNAATKHRSVGATNLNRASSRSHAILTIEASIVDPTANITLTGKINLVDLAGSENNKLTGNDPSRMAESSAINKSLSVLGQVVHALNQGASRIPYRNSKLTRILQDALGGSSVGLLICNLAPGLKFRQDTLNTLNFAVRTKNVENKPVVHERDNRPAPKPHFAVLPIQPPPARLAPAVLQAISTAGSGSGASRPRTSLISVPRSHRMSSIGGGNGYQAFGVNGLRRGLGVNEKMPESESNRSGNLGFAMTEKDIDERISKAVEAEVARRLAERERERERENAENEQAEEIRPAGVAQITDSGTTQSGSKLPEKEHSIPSGVLTPLLKRHKELDDELKSRLQELEQKYEQGNKETQLAHVLSPVSKKKTGRAYVALARAHSEKGDLRVALDLYRKAETYVPDNIKLKERIIEIEWAFKNNKNYIPSPKPPGKSKNKKKKKGKSHLGWENTAVREDIDVDRDGQSEVAGFGMELTNTNSPSTKSKRSFADTETLDSTETPPKRQKRVNIATPVVNVSSDDECVPPAVVKKARRKVVIG